MPLVVNLFGGPSIGKSTIAMGVAYELKLHFVNAELVTEFAKDLVWEESYKNLNNQLYMFANQHHRMFRCGEKVDVLVTDSPILLPLIFGKIYNSNMSQELKNLIQSEFKRENSLNIMLQRTLPYVEIGRVQTEEEAKRIDQMIVDTLDEEQYDYHLLPTSKKAAKTVAELTLSKLQSMKHEKEKQRKIHVGSMQQ